MRHLKLSVLLLLSLCLGACAGHSTFTQEKRQGDFHPEEMKELYVYSFLDARREYTGEAFITVFERTLSSRLQARGVKTHWLWFEDSPLGQNFSATEKDNGTGYGKIIPAPLVVMLNSSDEKTSGTTHRLLVFPKTVGLTGIHQAEREYYAQLTWTLERTAGPEPLLKGTSIFYSRPFRASADLQSDVDRLVDDFINGLYPGSSQHGAGN